MSCRSLWVVLALTTTVAACSDSSGPETDDLTQTEAAYLLSALSAVYLPTPSAPSPSLVARGPATVAALAPTTTTLTDSSTTTVACTAGGQVRVATHDTTTITTDVILNPSPDRSFVSSSDYQGRARVRTSYLSCGSRDSQGQVWTFNAEPGLSFRYDIDGETDAIGFTGGGSSSTSIVDWEGLWDGTLGWSYGGRSGTCSVAVEMESHSSYLDGVSTFSYSQSGQICGVEVAASGSSPL